MADPRESGDVVGLTTPTYQSLTTDSVTLRAQLEGSDVTTDAVDVAEALTAWENSRRFIASAINSSGSVLDYGCANGFLLRSLQEWCPYALVPYGIDIDRSRLDAAKTLFGDRIGHFGSPEDVGSLHTAHGFDFVYWAIGDNVDFTAPQNIRWLQSVAGLCVPSGRFIVGLYDSIEENIRKLADLARNGVHFTATVSNPRGSEVMAWVDGATAAGWVNDRV